MLERKDVVDFCSRLISTNSVSGNEEKVAGIIQDKMRELGYDEVGTDELGSVYGIIRGGIPKTIMFEGHMDTVDISDYSRWNTDPFKATIKDGRMYGRGTSDMKSAVGCMVIAGGDVVKMDYDKRPTVIVVGVIFEEIFEGKAFGNMLEHFKPDAVVNGESTNHYLMKGQKGRAEIEIVTHGKNAHSAHPEKGINAIMRMNDVLTKLNTLKCPEDDKIGKGLMIVTDIISSPYPGASVIPDRCRITIDRRLVLGETEESVINELESEIDGDESVRSIGLVTAEVTTYKGAKLKAERFFPAWVTEDEEPIMKAAKAAIADVGEPVETNIYQFCTDASECAGRRNIPTVGYGPGNSNLAHIDNEYVEIEDLYRVTQVYINIVRHFAEM